jgi:hypothetical protein
MKKSYTRVLHPAQRSRPLTREEKDIQWAEAIIEGVDAVHYAENNGAGPAPIPAKSNKVRGNNLGSCEREMTVHASGNFFDNVTAWAIKAEGALSPIPLEMRFINNEDGNKIDGPFANTSAAETAWADRQDKADFSDGTVYVCEIDGDDEHLKVLN